MSDAAFAVAVAVLAGGPLAVTGMLQLRLGVALDAAGGCR